MANEITTNLRIQLATTRVALDFNPGKILANQTTIGLFDRIASIAVTETTVTLTGITVPRLCILYNLDATNFCEAGTTTLDYPFRLSPVSFPSIFELNAGKTTLYLKANTLATLVRIIVLEL